MAQTFTQIIPAEPGWRALFGIDGDEVARSRVVAWALREGEGDQEIVGLIVDAASPTKVVAATDAVDPDGGAFFRYGFVES